MKAFLIEGFKEHVTELIERPAGCSRVSAALSSGYSLGCIPLHTGMSSTLHLASEGDVFSGQCLFIHELEYAQVSEKMGKMKKE